MGPDDFGTATYAQMMLYLNFKIGAYFAHLWKENMLAHHYEQKAKLLGNNIVRHFGIIHKGFHQWLPCKRRKDTRISHHAQYWGILSELYPTQYYDYLFDKVIPSIPFYKENISYEKDTNAWRILKPDASMICSLY